MARAQQGDVNHSYGGGRGDSNDEPDERREGKSAKGDQLKDQSVPRLKVVDHAKGQQK